MHRGIVVLYSPEVRAGLIRSEDGNHYGFPEKEWCSSRTARKNEEVVFTIEGSAVHKVKPVKV